MRASTHATDVGRALAVLYWPHPLIHALNRSLFRACEERCDNHVLADVRPTDYARMLLRLGERLVAARALSPSLPLVSTRWSLEARIAGILNPGRERKTRAGWRSVVLASAAVALAAVFAAGITVGDEAGAPAQGARSAPPRAAEDAAPTAGVSRDDPQQFVRAIARRSAYWLGPESPKLTTVDYTYLLGHAERPVLLVKGESRVRYTVWQGCTLRTGIHTLAAEPDRFAIDLSPGEDDGTVRVTATVEDAERPVRVEVGNGLDRSWTGYFSHSACDVVLLVDRERRIPLEEKVGATTLRYCD